MRRFSTLLLVCCAACLGTSPARGACPTLQPVAEAISGGLRPLPLPGMPEETCSKEEAIGQIHKLKDPLSKMTTACLGAKDHRTCEDLLNYIEQIERHLAHYNQRSASYEFRLDLIEAAPAQFLWNSLVARLETQQDEEILPLLNGLTNRVEAIEKKAGPAPNHAYPTSLIWVSLIVAIVAFVRTYDSRRVLKLREWLVSLFGSGPTSSEVNGVKDLPSRDKEDPEHLTDKLESKTSPTAEGEPPPPITTAEASISDALGEKELQELRRLGPEVSRRVSTIENSLVKREEVLRLIDERRKVLEASWSAEQSKRLSFHVKAELGPAFREYCGSPDFVALVKSYWPSPVPGPQEKAEVSAAFDLDSLKNAWGSFRRRDELEKLAKDFQDADSEEVRLRDLLERDLGKRLSSVTELKRSYETAVGPLEAYLFVMRKLKTTLVGTVRTAADEQGEVETSGQRNSPEVLLVRAREGHQLLTLLQATDLATRLRQFSFRNWLREEFRRFAESFFQTYAQQGSGEMEEARQIIVGALAYVGVRPMDIVLGRTRFDSLRHVGRGFDRLADRDDGVIIGIVRYGFDALDGKVFQPAEVIVNRRS